MNIIRWVLLGLIVGVVTYYGLLPFLEDALFLLLIGAIFQIDWMRDFGFAGSVGIVLCIALLPVIMFPFTRKKARPRIIK